MGDLVGGNGYVWLGARDADRQQEAQGCERREADFG
jgi:hypothetical protein